MAIRSWPNGTVVSTSRIPNEDSLDQELTDANLFSLNRFPGVDRLEGGIRVNAALHGAWNFRGGGAVDGLVGESYRFHKSSPWWVGSGLENQASDIVSRVSYTPDAYLDLTGRARFDPHEHMKVTFADALASAGTDSLRLSSGYIHSEITPYNAYDVAPFLLPPSFWGAQGKMAPNTAEDQFYSTPRDEITVGASTHYGQWRLSGYARQDLRTHSTVTTGGDVAFENECLIFHVIFYKRYTSIDGDHGDTGVLFQITLKTVGQFGFHGS